MAELTLQQACELAVGHYQAGRAGEAESLFRQILRFDSSHVDAMSMLAVLLSRSGRTEEAIHLARRAADLAPASANAQGNLAVVLMQLDRIEDAAEAYRRVLSLCPGSFEAHNNLGNVLRAQGRAEEAVAAYRRAVELGPQSPEVHLNLSNALLQLGQFPEGWREHEARLQARDFPIRNALARPLWDGSPLDGRRILIHREQGLGDTIQFVRYAPLVKQRGGHVIVQCPAVLHRLLADMKGIDEIVDDNAQPPDFDVHCPLMSLPHRFGTTLQTIPADIPYLRVRTELAERWKQRLGEQAGGLKVGLAWAGNPRHRYDRHRSMPFRQLAALGELSGVTYVSLQMGEAAAEARAPHAGPPLCDWTGELSDFADTAALAASLDLVISVDTAAAHLGGALGVPTWLMLHEPSGWRWLRNRDDSPWYPTMKLFRQPQRGDWSAVVDRVARELQATAALKEPSA